MLARTLMTSRHARSGTSSRIRKIYLDVKQSVTEAGNAPVSSPAARALVLRVAWPAAAVTALATGALFRMYETVKAQAAFIDAHNLPFSPPDPAPVLAGGILGAGVTLLIAGAAVEVATGMGIVDLPHLAAARLAAFVKSAGGAKRGRCGKGSENLSGAACGGAG
jgi:hypothetical protein